MTEFAVPLTVADQPAPPELTVLIDAIGLPQPPGRRGVRPPRLVKELARADVPDGGAWVHVWIDWLPAPVTVLAYREQLPALLTVGQHLRLVGLHATLEAGFAGTLGPLRFGLRCEQIEALP